MKIKTSYDYPPIPCRSMDWSAIDDDTYDYDMPIGRGPTELEAKQDLLTELEFNDYITEQQLDAALLHITMGAA